MCAVVCAAGAPTQRRAAAARPGGRVGASEAAVQQLSCPIDKVPRNGICVSAADWRRASRDRGRELDAARRARLRSQPWLAAVEPLPLECTLYARKIGAESVSNLAAVAFACDGLAFGWDCLRNRSRPAAAHAS